MQPPEHERFEETYQDTRHHVWRYLLRRLPWEEAEEAMAEVYTRAWSSRHGLRGPLPWLYGIARHVVAHIYAARPDTDTALTEPAPADSAEEHTATRTGALTALRQLSPLEREAVLLIAWEGLSAAQAARAAGCSTATMHLRLHRAVSASKENSDEDHRLAA